MGKEILREVPERMLPKVLPSVRRCHAPSRCALQKPLLNQVGLDHIFERIAILTNRRGEVFNPHGTTIKFVDDRQEKAAVN